jgi:hypothetical protein
MDQAGETRGRADNSAVPTVDDGTARYRKARSAFH